MSHWLPHSNPTWGSAPGRRLLHGKLSLATTVQWASVTSSTKGWAGSMHWCGQRGPLLTCPLSDPGLLGPPPRGTEAHASSYFTASLKLLHSPLYPSPRGDCVGVTLVHVGLPCGLPNSRAGAFSALSSLPRTQHTRPRRSSGEDSWMKGPGMRGTNHVVEKPGISLV